jgi:hypothetical protein
LSPRYSTAISLLFAKIASNKAKSIMRIIINIVSNSNMKLRNTISMGLTAIIITNIPNQILKNLIINTDLVANMIMDIITKLINTILNIIYMLNLANSPLKNLLN